MSMIKLDLIKLLPTGKDGCPYSMLEDLILATTLVLIISNHEVDADS